MTSQGAAPSLIVHNLPDGVDQEKVEKFFLLSKNGGSGDVEDVTYPLDGRHPNSARVTFTNASTVLRICSEERKMKENKLRLEAENIQQTELESDEPASLITEVPPAKGSPGAVVLLSKPGVGKQKEAKRDEGNHEQAKDDEKLVVYTMCRIHSDEFRRAVCKSCDKEPFVCVRCMTGQHNGHKFTMLEKEAVDSKTALDAHVSSDSGLKAAKSDVEIRLSRTKEKRHEAERLRSVDLERIMEDKTKILTALKEDYNKQLGLIDKDFNARQKALLEACTAAQKDAKTKWEAEDAKVESSVQAFGEKLTEMDAAIGHYRNLAKPFNSVELRNVKTEVEAAMTGLTDLQAASDRAVVSPVRPVDLSQYSSLTVEVVDKQTPVPPAAVVKVKEATPTQTRKTKGAAASTSGPRGTPSNGNTMREPSALIVYEVPQHVDETDLEVFFNNRKNGGCGDVEDVQFPVHGARPRTAKIFFDSTESIMEIISKPRHFDNGEKVNLEVEYLA